MPDSHSDIKPEFIPLKESVPGFCIVIAPPHEDKPAQARFRMTKNDTSYDYHLGLPLNKRHSKSVLVDNIIFATRHFMDRFQQAYPECSFPEGQNLEGFKSRLGAALDNVVYKSETRKSQIITALAPRTTSELALLGNLCRNSIVWESAPEGYDPMEFVLRRVISDLAENLTWEPESVAGFYTLEALKEKLRGTKKPDPSNKHAALIDPAPQGAEKYVIAQSVRAALKNITCISQQRPEAAAPRSMPPKPTPHESHVERIGGNSSRPAPVSPPAANQIVENSLSAEERKALGIRIEDELVNAPQTDIDALKVLCENSTFIPRGTPKTSSLYENAIQKAIDETATTWDGATGTGYDAVKAVLIRRQKRNSREETVYRF